MNTKWLRSRKNSISGSDIGRDQRWFFGPSSSAHPHSHCIPDEVLWAPLQIVPHLILHNTAEPSRNILDVFDPGQQPASTLSGGIVISCADHLTMWIRQDPVLKGTNIVISLISKTSKQHLLATILWPGWGLGRGDLCPNTFRKTSPPRSVHNYVKRYKSHRDSLVGRHVPQEKAPAHRPEFRGYPIPAELLKRRQVNLHAIWALRKRRWSENIPVPRSPYNIGPKTWRQTSPHIKTANLSHTSILSPQGLPGS